MLKTAQNSDALMVKTAWILTLAGFVPFAALAIAAFVLEIDDPYSGLAVEGLRTYGAVILSFLGGIRWGLALRHKDGEAPALTLAFGVIPSLVGWFSLFLPLPHVFVVQAIAVLVMGAWDILAGRNGLYEPWFVRLRVFITILVTLALAIGFSATI